MEKELEILQQIQYNRHITQRDLSRSTGLSLGTVNLLIKNMIKKGLIRIEKLSPKKMCYILTPEGMAEKIAKTYQYMVKSYTAISQMQKIIALLIEKQKEKGIDIIYLYGEENEVYKLIEMVLKTVSYDIKYQKLNNVEEILKKNKSIVFVWDILNQNELDTKDIDNINILKYML